MIGDPAIEVLERTGTNCLPFCNRLLVAPQPRSVHVPGWRVCQRRKQSKIDVHGLKGARAVVDGFNMTAGNMTEQRAEGRRRRRRHQATTARIGGGIKSSDQPNAGGLDITLAARHLAREPKTRRRSQAQLHIQQLRRIEESVAMQAAEPGEFGGLKSRDRAEDSLLRAVLQFGLKADHIVERAELVVL